MTELLYVRRESDFEASELLARLAGGGRCRNERGRSQLTLKTASFVFWFAFPATFSVYFYKVAC